MNDEEKKAAAEAEEAAFQDSLKDLSPEEQEKKKAERESQKETPDEKAAKLLNKDGKERKILVDQDRFNEINDQSKLYKAFAPIIDKVKDNPEFVGKLLETKEKGSLESRIQAMEDEKKEVQRREMKEAVTDGISRFKSFEKDWPEIQEQVELLIRKGLSPKEATRRSYLALHPEEAAVEAERIAVENRNVAGEMRTGGGYAPRTIDLTPSTKLNEREKKVAQDLIGKDFGNGFVPIKSEEDYARLLRKHEAHLKGRGFYDLP